MGEPLGSFEQWEENGRVQGGKAGGQVRRLLQQSRRDKVVACTRAVMAKDEEKHLDCRYMF